MSWKALLLLLLLSHADAEALTPQGTSALGTYAFHGLQHINSLGQARPACWNTLSCI